MLECRMLVPLNRAPVQSLGASLAPRGAFLYFKVNPFRFSHLRTLCTNQRAEISSISFLSNYLRILAKTTADAVTLLTCGPNKITPIIATHPKTKLYKPCVCHTSGKMRGTPPLAADSPDCDALPPPGFAQHAGPESTHTQTTQPTRLFRISALC